MTENQQQSRLTGAVVLMGSQALVLVLGYATHLWIGKVLGPASYGIYGIILSIQTIFGLLLTLGVPVAISRFTARDRQYAQSILKQGIRIQIIMGILVSFTLLLISPLIAKALGDFSLLPYLIFAAAVVFSQALYPVFTQFLSGLHQFNKQALLTSIYAVAKVVGALVLIYFFSVYGAFAGFIVGGIIAGILGWFWTKNIGGKQEQKLAIKSFLSFAGTYVLVLVGLQILISLDLFMVKAFLQNDIQAGYYNAAVTLSRIPYMLLQALGFVLLPSVSALTSPGESRQKATVFISDTIRYLIILIVPGVALAATTSKQLILLFFSQAYVPAAPVLTVLMLGLGALAFYLLLTNIVSGAGKPHVSLIITIILLVISGSLGTILIPRFGLIGAAWQTAISGIIGLIIITAYTFKKFSISLPIKSTVNVLIATTLAILPTYFWQANAITLIPQYLLVGIIYLTALLILKEINDSDKERVSKIHPYLRWISPKTNDKT